MGLSVFFYIRGMKYLIGIVLIGLLASCKDDVCSCHHLDVKEKRIGETVVDVAMSPFRAISHCNSCAAVAC